MNVPPPVMVTSALVTSVSTDSDAPDLIKRFVAVILLTLFRLTMSVTPWKLSEPVPTLMSAFGKVSVPPDSRP